MKTLHALQLLVACALLLAAPRASGQNSHLILDITGVAGSSKVMGYEDHIHLLALNYGGIAGTGPGNPARVDAIGMTMTMDPKAYPNLLQRVLTSQVFTSGFKVTALEPVPGGGDRFAD